MISPGCNFKQFLQLIHHFICFNRKNIVVINNHNDTKNWGRNIKVNSEDTYEQSDQGLQSLPYWQLYLV